MNYWNFDCKLDNNHYEDKYCSHVIMDVADIDGRFRLQHSRSMSKNINADRKIKI